MHDHDDGSQVCAVLCAWADSISDFTNSIYCRQQSGGWWWCDELNTQNPREQLNNEQNSTHNSEIWMWNLIKIHMRESNQTTNRQTICAELGKRSRTATKSRVVFFLCCAWFVHFNTFLRAQFYIPFSRASFPPHRSHIVVGVWRKVIKSETCATTTC